MQARSKRERVIQRRAALSGWLLTMAALLGCGSEDRSRSGSAGNDGEAMASSTAPIPDASLQNCEEAWRLLIREPALAGSPALSGANRARMLGRARGAVTLLVREPDLTTEERTARDEIETSPPGYRIARYLARHKRDRDKLRQGLLPSGYLFSPDPSDAFELELRVKLSDLFEEPRLLLERGEERYELTRKEGRGEASYLFATGPAAGQVATILFADRVWVADSTPGPLLHRDVVALQQREDFDRLRVERLTKAGHLVHLAFRELEVPAILDEHGPKLTLRCLRADAATREAVALQKIEASPRRTARLRLQQAVSDQVALALPFDRPREEKGPDKDGQLRPHWLSAYLAGRQFFEVEGHTYAVFRPDGQAQPPQVCVDFVLDSYERSSGAALAPRGEKPRRRAGQLDLGDYEIENRRGVLGFGNFAESRPDLFEVRRFVGDERTAFAKRQAFFDYLLEHEAEFRAGDVLAIQGLKSDGRVHQHAILLESKDPITGFPGGLADQMKVPRRRSWEGIMAEAPKRSLLYRARPLAPLVEKMAQDR